MRVNFRFFIIITVCLFFNCNTPESLDKQAGEKKTYPNNPQNYCDSYDLYIKKTVSLVISQGQKALSTLEEDAASCSKADIFQKMGMAYYYQGNFQLSTEYLLKSINLHKKDQSKYQVLFDSYFLSKNYLDSGNTKKAKEILVGVISEISEYKNTTIHARLLNILGKCYNHIGDFNASLKAFNTSLTIAEKVNDQATIALNFNELGIHFYQNDFYAKALEYHYKAFKIFKNIDNEIEVIHTQYNLARVYLRLQDYTKSKTILEESLVKSKSLGLKKETSNIVKSLGSRSKALKNYDKALEYYEEALAIAQKINFKVGIGKNLNNIGNIKSEQNKYNEALDNFNLVLSIYESINYVPGILECKVDLGKLFVDKKEYNNASKTFEECFKLLEQGRDNHTLAENVLHLSNTYRLEGNYKLALKYQVMYSDLSQLIFNRQESKNIALQKVIFETQKKESENKLLRVENEVKNLEIYKKNNLIITVIVTSFLFAIIAIIIYSRFLQKIKLNKQLRGLNNKLELTNRQLQTEALNRDKFFAIIAHELRNPLWWFRSLTKVLNEQFDTISKENLKKISNTLDESANNAFHLTENLLQWSKTKLGRLVYKPTTLNFSDLVDKNFQLFRLQIDQKEIEVVNLVHPETYVLADPQMMETIVRNLISNSLKHSDIKGMVKVYANQIEDRLEIAFEDKGEGIKKKHIQKILDHNYEFSNPNDSNKNSPGLGLKLCIDFIKRHRSELKIKNLKKGLQVKFSLPLAQNN